MQKSPVFLIAGASSDIGYTLTEKFAELSLTIMAHYSTNAARLADLSRDHVTLHQADLRRDEEAHNLVAATMRKFGRIDALINMIGPFAEQDLLDQSPADWRNVMDLNLQVAFSMSHYAAPFLIESKGQILNFTYAGVENLTAWPQATAYAAAKAGLAVLTKSLAQVLAPKGVRVNAVAPGWIDFAKFSKEKREEIAKQVPMGRLGRPDEVVDLAKWLLLDSPAFMTGAIIPLAGGLEF